jgi:UDP-glucuronate decarboxylase
LIDELVRRDIQTLETSLQDSLHGGLGSKKVIVTGGAGFLGSWLCDLHVSAGAEVLAVDNLSTGRIQNIDHLQNQSAFDLQNLDVATFEPRTKSDLIFHFASRASPEEYQAHPIETLAANSRGTEKLLELARRTDATFLYASTSEVYGDSELVPTPETYWGKVNPNGPRSCYDEGKRYGEALCAAYRKEYGIDVRVVRIFNTYGPRLRADGAYGRAVSRFITQALKGEDMSVFGDGSQTRSFCYVTDTISGILRMAYTDAAKGETINIGNPNEVSIIELARLIPKLVRVKSKITFKPLPADDPKRRCPDISKAKRLLDWNPRIDLNEGLQKTIEWFRTN